jgi:acyl-CoA reductase-like NAD-dependent aldehyde dehydrogenase
MLCSVLVKAGVPPGVVNMVFGNGSNAGSQLVSHPKVPLVSFTGGTATGQMIYKSCSSLNKKMSLELGGKNACIIFEDFDFNDVEALNVISRSCFANQGNQDILKI